MKRPDLYRLLRSFHQIVALMLLVMSCHLCLAQAGDSTNGNVVKKALMDTISIVEKARRFGELEIQESILEFRQDLNATKRQEQLERIKNETFDARDFVKKGIDTTGLTRELRQIADWYLISVDGIFINTGSAQTYRNLTTSRILINELRQRLLTRKLRLDNYARQLLLYRNRIDSFATDSSLFLPPTDSLGAEQYFSELVVAARAIAPADSVLKKAIVTIQLIQRQVNTMVNELSTSLDNIGIYQRDLSATTFKRDFANLGDTVKVQRSFKEILHFSALKAGLVLYFYAGNNIGKLLLIFVLASLSYWFISSLKERLAEDGRLSEDRSGQLIFRYPLLSAILIVLNIFQFIFPQPPFVLTLIFWLSASIVLAIIFRGFISRYWLFFWLTVFAFFVLAAGINLVLQASRVERWLMLALSGAAFLVMLFIFITGKKKELREKWIIYFIGIAVVLELAATIANIYGRYNLSKMLLTTGIFNIVTGILFAWTIRLINEGLLYANELYTTPERHFFYVNFKRVGTQIPVMFKGLFMLGWVILLGRNFYAFNKITGPVHAFLVEPRTIGAFTFTIENIALFFGILAIASLVSQIVSFFAADKHDPDGKRIKGVGSWLLLIRITIVSIGLFMAFAAAGIPLDKITIIVGALSVGIGFGLQTLINNLISGLIISFERPVNVGDMVEIRGRSGIMKSIGFRSSIMTTSDGAEIIIPNGDLLNEHLVNWTLNDSTRRIEIDISVANGTDLAKVQPLLLEMVKTDTRVAAHPAPVVLVKEIHNNGVDFQAFFWAKDIRQWSQIKSDVLMAIEKSFSDRQIKMASSQQEIYLHPGGTGTLTAASNQDIAKK